jgi:hypothetical protein
LEEVRVKGIQVPEDQIGRKPERFRPLVLSSNGGRDEFRTFEVDNDVQKTGLALLNT